MEAAVERYRWGIGCRFCIGGSSRHQHIWSKLVALDNLEV